MIFSLFQIIDPATATLVAGGIGAGVNMIGNLLGFGSNKAANETNREIAQMNNEFNERMFDKQIDYNWQMWNATNQYNSASAQRKRLEDAGLNPYLMMNGGNAGIAQGGSAVSPPSAQAVEVRPYQPDFQGVAQAAQQVADYEVHRAGIEADNDYKRAMARQAESDATFRDAMNAYKLEELLWHSKGSKEDWHSKQLQNMITLKSFDELARKAFLENKYLESQEMQLVASATYYNTAAQLQKEQVRWVAPQALARISADTSQAALNVQLGKESKERALKTIADRLETETRTDGLRFENASKAIEFNNLYKLADQIYEAERERLKATKSGYNLQDYQNRKDKETEIDYHDFGSGMRFYKRNSPVSFGVHN